MTSYFYTYSKEESFDSDNKILSIERLLDNCEFLENDYCHKEITEDLIVFFVKKEKNKSLLDVKKIADYFQFVELPKIYENKSFIKITNKDFKNYCYTKAPPAWWNKFKFGYNCFFVDAKKIFAHFEEDLKKEGICILKSSSTSFILSNGKFNYTFSTVKYFANAIFEGKNFGKSISTEIKNIRKYFASCELFYKKAQYDLKEYQLELKNGVLKIFNDSVWKNIDYESYINEANSLNLSPCDKSFLNLIVEDKATEKNKFPTVVCRSLVYKKAHPTALCSYENGYLLCASLEYRGTQKKICMEGKNFSEEFSLWQRRSSLYVNRLHFTLRAILEEDIKSPNLVGVVGEQASSLLVFPSLIRGLLDKLSLDFGDKVKLVSKSENILIIAKGSCPWALISDFNEKASLLLNSVAKDGSDPLDLLEEIILPKVGTGNFLIRFAHFQFFSLLERASFNKTHKNNFGQANYLRGLAFSTLDEHGLAAKEFSKAFMYDKDDSNILYALGRSLLECQRFKEAEKFLKRAFDLNPKDYSYAHSYGKAMLAQGKVKEASEAFLASVNISPGSSEVLFDLSQSYFAARRYDKALKYLKETIKCDPEHANAHKLLSQIYLISKKDDLAKKHALLAYRSDPFDQSIANLLFSITLNG